LQAQPGSGELHLEDLARLPPADVQTIYEWVLEKLDGFAASWKDTPDEEGAIESQNLNDIDLFSLKEGNEEVTVHRFWLNHLEDRVMGPDSTPQKAMEGEDPARVGLVLEWVYGSVVSTSEKARESARRQLHPHHPPDPNAAWSLLHAVRPRAHFLCAYLSIQFLAIAACAGCCCES
jgi:hypothetical protein